MMQCPKRAKDKGLRQQLQMQPLLSWSCCGGTYHWAQNSCKDNLWKS